MYPREYLQLLLLISTIANTGVVNVIYIWYVRGSRYGRDTNPGYLVYMYLVLVSMYLACASRMYLV